MPEANPPNEKPPLFPNWGYWYGFLIVLLLVNILIFYALTLHFK